MITESKKNREFLFVNNDVYMGELGLWPKSTLLEIIENFNRKITATSEHPPCTMEDFEDFDVHELNGTYSADTMHVVEYWIADARNFTMTSKCGDYEPLKWGTLRKLPDIDDFSDNILSPFVGLRNVEATRKKMRFTIGGTTYCLEAVDPPRESGIATN